MDMHHKLSTSRTALSCALALCFAGYQSFAFAQDPVPDTPPASETPAAANTDAKADSKTTKPEAAKPDASGLKPFKEIIKGAKESKGFFTLHQKDEKVWLEIKPDQFDKPFFFSVNVTNGVGQAWLNGSWMWGSNIGVFHRVGNHVQLIAKNAQYTAASGTPQAMAVEQGFSDSLLATSTVLSQPEAESKAVLIDANALLFIDIPGYSTALDYLTHVGYGFDSRNTSFADVHNDVNLTG
jgi:hypothetical protein